LIDVVGMILNFL